MGAKILVVDDEPAITENVQPLLEREGFEVATADSAETALFILPAFQPDLIVLDIMLPEMNGREMLRCLRQAGNTVPVIMLSQVKGASERSRTLDEGADDYLKKPFSPKELISRIKAVLRRRTLPPSLKTAPHLACGPLLVNRETRRATLDGKELTLSSTEFAVLEYLISRPQQIISRDELLKQIWGWGYAGGTRVVDNRVADLRRVLDEDPARPRFIQTWYGQGYQFIGQVEALP
jgi:DNA-binding response OmpR family regulator